MVHGLRTTGLESIRYIKAKEVSRGRKKSSGWYLTSGMVEGGKGCMNGGEETGEVLSVKLTGSGDTCYLMCPISKGEVYYQAATLDNVV